MNCLALDPEVALFESMKMGKRIKTLSTEQLTVKQQEWMKRKAAEEQQRLNLKATKYIKRVDVTSLAAAKEMSVMEAAQLHLKANAGDAAARKVVWEARCERKAEKRVQELAAKGGMSMDDARALLELARDGDEAARARIRDVREAHRRADGEAESKAEAQKPADG